MVNLVDYMALYVSTLLGFALLETMTDLPVEAWYRLRANYAFRYEMDDSCPWTDPAIEPRSVTAVFDATLYRLFSADDPTPPGAGSGGSPPAIARDLSDRITWSPLRARNR
jgi:hypothetical protein